MAVTRSNLGPLTTTFTAPAQCSTYGAQNGYQESETYWLAQTCNGDGPRDAAECWPEQGRTGLWPPLGGYGFYSPGLHCPTGYHSACTAAVLPNGSPSSVSGASFLFQNPLIAGETAIGCCPTGMTCFHPEDGVQTCAMVITQGQVKPVGYCTDTGVTEVSTYYSNGQVPIGSPWPEYNDLIVIEALLQAPLIQLVFQSTDISPQLVSSNSALPFQAISTAFATSTASTTSSTSSTSKTTAASTVSTTSIIIATPESSGALTTSTKVAIGLGVSLSVVFVLLAFAACVLFRRRRKSSRAHQAWQQQRQQQQQQQQGGGHYPETQYAQQQQPIEVPNNTKQGHSAQGSGFPAFVRSELPAR